MRMQECFAIKPGISAMLDVARKSYSESIEDIHNLIQNYKQQYNLNSIKLQFNTRRGYFISFDKQNINNLQTIFIQISQQGKKINCSTEQLIRLNQRNNDSLQEILLMTEKIINDLIYSIRQNIHIIYKISDSIAWLDMISSFVTYVNLSSNSVRPEFTKEGPLVIKQGRHPIIQSLFSQNFIAVRIVCYFF
jgi:DNA mismatch repair protein MSH4